MDQIDRGGIAIVPKLDGSRAGLRPQTPSLLGRIAAGGPVALVVTGVVTSALWAGFLGWCVFSAVRWAIG